MKGRKLLSILLALALCIGTSVPALAVTDEAAATVSSWTKDDIIGGWETAVYIDGELNAIRVNLDRDMTLSFELRTFMESIGYTVNMNADTEAIEMVNANNRIVAFPDSSICTAYGSDVDLGKPIYLEDDYMFFPQTFLSSVLNMSIVSLDKADGSNRIDEVRISSGINSKTQNLEVEDSDVWIPDATAVEAANRLYELGLFSGVGNNADGTPNFDLTRTLNRQEAVTMLVRLLGKEGEALAGSQTHTFTDVADWARPYVTYAQINGLTSGTSATTFGGTDAVTATQYLTFILRALGYSSDSDFAWDAAWVLTDELGITNGEYGEGAVLVRGEAAIISEKALDVTMKDGLKTLLEVIEESLASEPRPNTAGTNDIEIDFGSSTKFSEEEIKSAIDVVIADFNTSGGGSYIKRIWYDEATSDSQIEEYMTVGMGSVNGIARENVIVLLLDYYSGSNSVEPNVWYYDWERFLIRENPDSPWVLDVAGY